MLRHARALLSGLLVVGSVLFLTGTLIERSGGDGVDTRGQQAAQTDVQAGAGERDEAREVAGAEHESERGETEAHEDGERVFGVDVEWWPLPVAGVLLGLGLAAAVGHRPTDRGLLLVDRDGPQPHHGPDAAVADADHTQLAAAISAVAALDGVDTWHLLNEDRTGLAVVAGIVTALHLAAAALARRADGRGRGAATMRA